MDPIQHITTKALLMRDFRKSGKDLGTFALEWMKTYDEICFELVLIDAYSKGKRLTGTAMLESCDAIEKLIEKFEISGTYTINLVDTQKEFFLLLQEIKEELEYDPNSGFSSALREYTLVPDPRAPY
jgi:hypothetical protein